MRRTSGRTSLASTPSLRATSTVSTPPDRLTITCLTRGSAARNSLSILRNASTFSSLPSESIGSSLGYNERPLPRTSDCVVRLLPSRAIARADFDAAIRASPLISSE